MATMFNGTPSSSKYIEGNVWRKLGSTGVTECVAKTVFQIH